MLRIQIIADWKRLDSYGFKFGADHLFIYLFILIEPATFDAVNLWYCIRALIG